MKSLYLRDKIKIKDSSELEFYKLALGLAKEEANVLWNFSQNYLLANTIIIGFISQGIFEETKIIFEPNNGIFALSLIGLTISLLWLFSYRRRSNYYKFRIAQARQREPSGLSLVGGDGEYFSKGDTIEIEGKGYSLGVSRAFRTSWVMTLFISLFILLYIAIICISSPWGIISR